MMWFLPILTSLLALGSPVSDHTPACSCIIYLTGDERTQKFLDDSDIAFYGRVVAARIVDEESYGGVGLGEYEFEVSEWFKSPLDSKPPGEPTTGDELRRLLEPVAVRTGWGGGDCGTPFELRESAVVYARVAPDATGVYYTGICDGTRSLDEPGGEEELARLRRLAR